MSSPLPNVIPIQQITRGSQPDTYRLFNGIKETTDQNRNLPVGQNLQGSNWRLHELQGSRPKTKHSTLRLWIQEDKGLIVPGKTWNGNPTRETSWVAQTQYDETLTHPNGQGSQEPARNFLLKTCRMLRSWTETNVLVTDLQHAYGDQPKRS